MKGWKTYLCAAGYGITEVLSVIGIIDSPTAETLRALFFAGGLAALRAGVSKAKIPPQ